MNKRLFTSFLLVCSVLICEESFSFQMVDLDEINPVSEGNIELYENENDSNVTHEVWLYTAADCAQISWTLGGQTHGTPLSCGSTTGFMNVPPGIHYTVIEGCGKRIAAYLSVKRDMHLMVEPSDLGSCNSCPGDGEADDSSSFYVDFLESLNYSSFVSGL